MQCGLCTSVLRVFTDGVCVTSLQFHGGTLCSEAGPLAMNHSTALTFSWWPRYRTLFSSLAGEVNTQTPSVSPVHTNILAHSLAGKQWVRGGGALSVIGSVASSRASDVNGQYWSKRGVYHSSPTLCQEFVGIFTCLSWYLWALALI